MWDTQDHVKGKKATGIITFCDREKTKLAKVQWAGGNHKSYRIGANGAFDLSIKGINKIRSPYSFSLLFMSVVSLINQ